MRTVYGTVAWGLFLLLPCSGHTVEDPGVVNNVKEDNLLQLAIEPTSTHWLLGLPLWLRAEIKSTCECTLVGPYSTWNAFSGVGYRLELRSSAGALVHGTEVRVPSHDLVHGPANRIFRKIAPFGRLRMVFPVPPMKDPIPEGVYEASFSFMDEDGKARHRPVTFTLAVRNLTEAESKSPAVRAASAKIVEALPEGQLDLTTLPESLKKAVGFELLLKQVVASRVPLRDMDPSTVSVAPGLEAFEPELNALKYEILLSRDDKDAAKQLRDRTVKEEPGIEWLFKEIDEGVAPIRMAKKALAHLLRQRR